MQVLRLKKLGWRMSLTVTLSIYLVRIVALVMKTMMWMLGMDLWLYLLLRDPTGQVYSPPIHPLSHSHGTLHRCLPLPRALYTVFAALCRSEHPVPILLRLADVVVLFSPLSTLCECAPLVSPENLTALSVFHRTL
jgi:hypothetical protein